jgi:hypothetical protein
MKDRERQETHLRLLQIVTCFSFHFKGNHYVQLSGIGEVTLVSAQIFNCLSVSSNSMFGFVYKLNNAKVAIS